MTNIRPRDIFDACWERIVADEAFQRRFWNRVKKCRRCWLWTGARSGNGYGMVTIPGRKSVGVHRVSYFLVCGSIPAGLVIDHLCRVRHCVNPQHMEAVTVRENTSRGFAALKKHCPQGHPYSGVDCRGHRFCKICHAQRERARQRRTK